MSATENKFILSNGMEVPCIGFGTYNAKGGDNLKMIKDAIEVGYRYFDTASLYGTERALGQAIKESGIPRDQFIIASKVWIDEMGYENTKAALHRSLSRLQTDYLDFYLIHWPKPKEADENWKELDLESHGGAGAGVESSCQRCHAGQSYSAGICAKVSKECRADLSSVFVPKGNYAPCKGILQRENASKYGYI